MGEGVIERVKERERKIVSEKKDINKRVNEREMKWEIRRGTVNVRGR